MKKYNVARIAIAIALLLVAFTCQACSDDKLKAIASNVDRVAILIKDGREIKDELETQAIISQDEGRKISLALLKVNNALKAFNTQAKLYASAGEIDPAGKADLKQLATNIANAVGDLISDGTFGVKNAEAQARINAAIGSLKQVTLAIVDTVTLIKAKGVK